MVLLSLLASLPSILPASLPQPTDQRKRIGAFIYWESHWQSIVFQQISGLLAHIYGNGVLQVEHNGVSPRIPHNWAGGSVGITASLGQGVS